MRLKDPLPFLSERIEQVDWLVGSISKNETYDVWIIKMSHHYESASVIYKMVNLRRPRESTGGVIFVEPVIKYQVLVLQYAETRDNQLLGFIQKDRDSVDIVPGSDAQSSKFMFIKMDYDQAAHLVEQFGAPPTAMVYRHNGADGKAAQFGR